MIQILNEFNVSHNRAFMSNQIQAVDVWGEKNYPELKGNELFDKWIAERAADYREEWKKAHPDMDIDK